MPDTDPSLADRLLPLYPVLAELPPPLLAMVVAQHAQRLQLPAAQILCDERQPCMGFPMRLARMVRSRPWSTRWALGAR